MLINYYAPRRQGAWFLLLDLDEFIQVPIEADHNLAGVLRTFELWGADLVRIHWLVFGPNNILENPTCAVLSTYLRPAQRYCTHHQFWKSAFRAKPGLFPSRKNLAHYQVVERRNFFLSDGTNLSRLAQTNKIDPNRTLGTPPAHPLLQLRHYATRSEGEYLRKVRRYQMASISSQGFVPHRYTNKFAQSHLREFRSGRCVTNVSVQCVPMREWAGACPAWPRVLGETLDHIAMGSRASASDPLLSS